MADSDNKNAAPANARAENAATSRALPKDKSARRRKMIGRGQTSLSSASAIVMPGTASFPELAEAKHEAPSTPAPVEAIAVAPAVDVAIVEEVVASSNVDVAAPKRNLGRPRKQRDASPVVQDSAPIAKRDKPSAKPVVADDKPVAAAPIAAKTVAAKPAASEPAVIEPVATEPDATKPDATKPAATKPAATKPTAVNPVAANPVSAQSLPVEPVAEEPITNPVSASPLPDDAAHTSASPKREAPEPITTSKPLQSSFVSIKDMTMDMSANFNGFQGAMSEAQAKAQQAFEKSSSMLNEAGDFAKGNVEAMIESTKILADGVKGMGSSMVSEGRTAFEAMTADVKELAAVKSPTDFFKLQSEMVRKNFDTAVAQSSKNTETFLKLMSDAFAPMSGRVSLAVEKARQVAPMNTAMTANV